MWKRSGLNQNKKEENEIRRKLVGSINADQLPLTPVKIQNTRQDTNRSVYNLLHGHWLMISDQRSGILAPPLNWFRAVKTSIMQDNIHNQLIHFLRL